MPLLAAAALVVPAASLAQTAVQVQPISGAKIRDGVDPLGFLAGDDVFLVPDEGIATGTAAEDVGTFVNTIASFYF